MCAYMLHLLQVLDFFNRGALNDPRPEEPDDVRGPGGRRLQKSTRAQGKRKDVSPQMQQAGPLGEVSVEMLQWSCLTFAVASQKPNLLQTGVRAVFGTPSFAAEGGARPVRRTTWTKATWHCLRLLDSTKGQQAAAFCAMNTCLIFPEILASSVGLTWRSRFLNVLCS